MGSKEYRLMKSGKCGMNFAKVTIDVIAKEGGTKVSDKTENENPDDGKFDSTSAPDWVEAAVEGARLAGKMLEPHKGSHEIAVLKIVGTISDTTVESVKCAAVLAVWREIAPDLPAPKLEIRDGRCVLEFE